MSIINSISLFLTVFSAFYLVISIFLDIQARQRLIQSCLKNRDSNLEILIVKMKQGSGSLTEQEIQLASTLLDEEIKLMHEGRSKAIMRNNFDRKTRNNQERYALEIFSDSKLVAALT